MMHKLLLFWVLIAISFISCQSSGDHSPNDWSEYHGNGERNHYSALAQIDTSNVHQLQVAWKFASGGADTLTNRSQIQCNAIVIKGILYGVSADIQAFAVEAATGKELWKTQLSDNKGTLSRGVSYWSDGKEERIFFGAGKWLYALNAHTGALIPTFADSGRLDLKLGIERPGGDHHFVSNTPNTIYKNLIITSGRVSESETALLGDIRAYDTRTGDLVWTFHTIPTPEDTLAHTTWSPEKPRERLGGANTWMGMAIDREEGIVYAPTGSAAYDFWGGNRVGDNLYANCILVLDATTGKKRWHYQLVHHDIWDRAPPSTPNLLTIQRNGESIKAVAVVTKQGHTFVFDRLTGAPLFPIEERPFPTHGVEGEIPSPTQPIPTLPLPFTRQGFTSKDFWSQVEDRDSLEQLLTKARTGHPYIPITAKMTVFFPGTDGGAQWGGAATDPEGTLYVPAKEIPVYTTLIPTTKRSSTQTGGEHLYQVHCAACHGADRKGNHDGTFPSLLQIEKKRSFTQLQAVLQQGKGLPSFSHISTQERDAIFGFLLEQPLTQQPLVSSTSTTAIPFQHTGYNRWYHKGYPVSTPPWGTLTAIDLNTGKHKWQIPLGEYPELTQQGVPLTGTDNYGGPLVTSGNVLFIAATRDEKIRAFDKHTGKLL